MSMFDLNGEEFKKPVSIFNNGVAGKVNNVKISKVEKKPMDGAPGAPDYKVYFADASSEINQGFWKEPKNPKYEIQRMKSIADALVPSDFVYPAVKDGTAAAAIDVLAKVIRDNSPEKLLNVFVTYGTEDYPSNYLNLRYFNFVESSETPEAASRLTARDSDLLIKLEPDAATDETEDNVNELGSSDDDADIDTWV